MMKLTPLLLLLASTSLPLAQAVAQTAQPAPRPAPARPAAKPAPAAPAPAAAADRTATLGGGTGTGTGARQPILTRDELRACFSLEESIRVRIAEHQQARAPLDVERQGITAQQEALRTERAQLDTVSTRVGEFRGRMEAHAARVTQWNKDSEAFNAKPPTGSAGDRERTRLNTEREAIQAAQAGLETERASVVADAEKAVTAFNAKAKQLEVVVGNWNQRNQAWNDSGVKLEDERKGWVASCADRRYREEDEIAIKAGR